MQNNILIVGASGHIGSHIYLSLLEQNDINLTATKYHSSNEDFIKIDLTNQKEIGQFVEKLIRYNILIFLVGLAHEKGKASDKKKFNQINYRTLTNLLNALDSRDKLPDKIIFASTISVYGEKYNQIIYDENTVPEPFSPYAVTKLEAEQYLLKNYSNRSWILRIAPVYSSTFSLNIDRRTKIGSIFYRVGNGSNNFSICNIKNIKSTIEGITNNIIPVGVYNISDNTSYNYNELIKWQGASFVMRVPKLIVQFLFYFGRLFGNIFLQENTTKLLTDNIYPNNKITAFIELPYTLNDIKLDNNVNS